MLLNEYFSSSIGMTASSSASKPISTESLENAAKNIDSALQSDRQYSELDALLRNARHAGGTLVYS